MTDILKIVLILIVTTLSGSIGALALKQGMNELAEVTFVKAITNKWLLIGCFLYIVSAATNIVLFKFLDYSIAFPMTSLTYVWTVFISYFTFKEKITPLKLLSVGLIMIGVVIISQ
ncbi:DMT family transporter [Vagococcus hydrophili]|uniref:Multidrug transporter n=1 Tax=Vagococcus hydrophili TaxID=2714947 RepID=A0A6G8AVA3_9ENTE|nr:EamA family transporter [Vagococcus hydrophili]QIL48843.1 multidrug transporter [Vagococcus hydrophili]